MPFFHCFWGIIRQGLLKDGSVENNSTLVEDGPFCCHFTGSPFLKCLNSPKLFLLLVLLLPQVHESAQYFFLWILQRGHEDVVTRAFSAVSCFDLQTFLKLRHISKRTDLRLDGMSNFTSVLRPHFDTFLQDSNFLLHLLPFYTLFVFLSPSLPALPCLCPLGVLWQS